MKGIGAVPLVLCFDSMGLPMFTPKPVPKAIPLFNFVKASCIV